jgi:two-component system, LytTR family, response regulator
MIKCILVDDEPLARDFLSTILSENCPETTIVATAADVLTAVKMIQEHKPDIVFLDVEMPGYSGFQLLDFFDNIDFQVIFTTAHADYALRAFQVSAVDYLLKPIQIEQIVRAVKKAIILRGSNMSNENLKVLKENLQEGKIVKIALPVGTTLIFVSPEDFMTLSADGSYTNIVLIDGRKFLISKKLKEFEDVLKDYSQFFRAHRSHLINMKYVKQYNKSEGGMILMNHDIELPLSKEKKDEFFDKMNIQAI